MEPTGNTDGQDGVFGECVEMSERVGTMGFRQRFSVLEEIRYLETMRDSIKGRLQGLKRMIEHDDRLVAFHSSDTTKIEDETQ